MSKDTLTVPLARTWREIPQQVKPRAMSREGRKRLAMRVARLACVVVALGAGIWCAFRVAAVLKNDPRGTSASARAAPIGDHVVLVTDGVLDRAWLVRTLSLPPRATLLGIDPASLRARVMSTGQVLSASIVRDFPATLTVRISERSPVASVMGASGDGTPKPFLVARDGTIYEGLGYNPGMLKTLPWLDGVRLVRHDQGFQPIEGMEHVAALLGRAKLEAEHLYLTWQIVSLSRLQSDGIIEVRTRDGLRISFGTQEDFFRQLARLDLILDSAAKAHPGQTVTGEIDLSIGAQVPVRLAVAAPPSEDAPAAPAPSPPFQRFRIHIN